MNIANLLKRTARTFPNRAALAHGKEITATYQEFDKQSSAIATALVEKYKLKKGDRVALIMKNHPEYWVALFAVWRAGLVAVPANAKLHISEFQYILDDSESKLCFATPELSAGLKALNGDYPIVDIASAEYEDLKSFELSQMTDVEPDDLAWLFYTSGTTGKPKGAMLSHRNILACIMNYFTDVATLEPGDAVIHAAPQTHGSGLYGIPFIAKAGIQVTPRSGGFDPAETLELIKHYKNSCFFFAPTMVHRLIGSDALVGADTSNLKLIIYGGGPMYEAGIRKALEVLGPKFSQIYGLGEAPMTITGLSQWELAHNVDHPNRSARLASVGVERTDVEVRIIAADGSICAVGDVGEITVRGDVVMLGYWKNEEATSETIRDGWLYTGDMGCMDDDGFLTLKDRSKDMIISGGTNIYPREIEEVLLKHPAVDEVSIVGRLHEDWGEEVVAFVVAKEGQSLDTKTLDDFCIEHMARFKRPKEYFYPASLPKNNYGKVLKTELRKQLET